MRILIGAIVFLWGIGIFCIYGKTHQKQSSEKTATLTNSSKPIFECLKNFPNGTQAPVALIKNGVVYFVGAINEYDSTFYTYNKNKLFEIGSITKVFKAILLANLLL